MKKKTQNPYSHILIIPLQFSLLEINSTEFCNAKKNKKAKQ